MAAVQYLPWADGAAILLHGKLPLEGLLVFFGGKVADRGKVIRPSRKGRFPTRRLLHRLILANGFNAFSGSQTCASNETQDGLSSRS